MIYQTWLFWSYSNDKRPNDSRRIMPFVASVPFWFLARKVCFEELFDSLSCASLDIFYFSRYPLSLKARTCGSHAWLLLGSHRTLIRSKAFYICSYISLNTCSFQGFNFHSFLWDESKRRSWNVILTRYDQFLSSAAGFHMTSLKFKLKNYRSYQDFTFTMH